MDAITILTYISLFAGGVLVILMVLSLLGGLDLDFDLGESDFEMDAGNLGVIKGLLIFVSIGSWVMKLLLVSHQHPAMAITIGLVAGVGAFMLLSYLFKLLLRNQENVNWTISDTLYQEGKVYLKIPGGGESGIVQVNVKGALREMKAKSRNDEEIATGESVAVVDLAGEYVIVKATSGT